MTTTRTHPFQEVEHARYGERQHESGVRPDEEGTTIEFARYGDPQHEEEAECHPECVHRLGYEDDHWREQRRKDEDRPNDGGPASGRRPTGGEDPAGRTDPSETARGVTGPSDSGTVVGGAGTMLA